MEAPGFCAILGETCNHPDCDEGRNCPARRVQEDNEAGEQAGNLESEPTNPSFEEGKTE